MLIDKHHRFTASKDKNTKKSINKQQVFLRLHFAAFGGIMKLN